MISENKHTIPKGCPNYGNCFHRKKTLEELKKSFPYYPDSLTLKELQIEVCQLCKSEWNIPRFNIQESDWEPPKKEIITKPKEREMIQKN